MYADEQYLVKGLAAMANAGHWFDAHWGACIIASKYLCDELSHREDLCTAIRKEMDVVMGLRGRQFDWDLWEQPSVGCVDKIPDTLDQLIGDGLRAHGHAVIYSAISLRALNDVPHAAMPTLVDGICGQLGAIGKTEAERSSGDESYIDIASMVDATIDAIVRCRNILGRPETKRPNFTHMITHTDALMTLDELGYGDLSKKGHSGLKRHIDFHPPDPSGPKSETPVDHGSLWKPDFWMDEGNRSQWSQPHSQDNPNGDWIANGHLFKFMYSYGRIESRASDIDKSKLCADIVSERYLNACVKGG